MALNKGDIVRSVVDKVRFKKRKVERQQYLFPEFYYLMMSRKKATDIVNSLFNIIGRSLEKGEPVRISGFGKFHVKFQWARKGRHPRTGETIVLESRRVIKFKSFSRLRENVKKDSEEEPGSPIK